jgi:hypothetical protein
MLSAAFEPAIPTIERPLTYALDRTTTGNDLFSEHPGKFCYSSFK